MTSTQKVIKYCAIVLAVVLIAAIFGGIIEICSEIYSAFRKGSDAVGEWQTHEINDTEGIENLDVTVGGADLEILSGDTFSLKSNQKYLKVRVKNGTLYLEDEGSYRLNDTAEAQIILTVPSGFSFDTAEIETGAGRFTVDSFSVRKLRMELGAGEAFFENLNVTSEAEIHTGVGKFTVLGGSISELDMQIGVGDVSLRAALLKDSEIDCGIGKTEICLLGTKDDYSVSVNKGFGLAKIDGNSVSNDETVGNGSVSVEINGGIGDMEIYFKGTE